MIFSRGTLGLYFLRRVTVAIFIVCATFFVLIYTADLIELMRRAGDAQKASTATLARLALLRVPTVTEQIFPFAVLFGGLASFLMLNRRLEFIIARAAGISAWQFISPAILLAFVMGLFIMTVYNPISVAFKNSADEIESQLFGRAGVDSVSSNGIWLDQKSADGGAILRADTAAGQTLFNVTAFVSDKDGHFVERIEAPTVDLQKGFWRFNTARIVMQGSEPRNVASYDLATNLSADELSSTIGASESVSFWALPGVVARLELAGLDATRYRLKYQTLLARPALLIAMILVAASVSLRFFRFGGVANMVLGGVAAGFLLYVITKLAENLGSAGVISAVAAAWTPAMIGAMLGTLTLLHQEDG
ncbi:MAG: LPS export ABC transporter permease LptG [Beijerinckiaceae bacterium]|nr:LPS export ABC transporter permease LptG [Beijerinckiaceae bacterium]